MGGEALAELLPGLHTFLPVQLYLVEEESEVSLSEGQGQVGSGSHTASLSPGQGGLNYEDPFGLERKQTVFRKGGAGVGGRGG